MTRLATLLCLLASVAAPAAAREPVARVIYRVPAGPPMASPWTLHPVLLLPTPLLAVSDRDTTDGGTTAGFFARLTAIGFTCVTREPKRRRIRRTEVFCARGEEEWFSYAGGWPKGGGAFVVDRIRAGREGSAELLGGAQVGGHVRAVLGTAEPQQVVTVQATAVRRPREALSGGGRSSSDDLSDLRSCGRRCRAQARTGAAAPRYCRID